MIDEDTLETGPTGSEEGRRFVVYPAIDLRGGKVVRLKQGEASKKTVYGDDPVAVARSFVAEGAAALHVVDLDAAFGEGDNRDIIHRIADAVAAPVQVGGGVRTDRDVATLFDAGVTRCIVGSAAIERPDWVAALSAKYGDRIVVGIDARDGEVRVSGWTEGSGRRAADVARAMVSRGIREIVYTNIARDGMLVGPDVEASARLANATGARVIVSGGVGSLDHVRGVAERLDEGLVGVVVGKALYEARFSLEEALEAARAQA